MPIKTSQRILHLRTQKNAEVEDNLARLWHIGRNSHSAEDLLKQLHPWGAPNSLKFDNGLAIFLICITALLLLPTFLQPSAIWAQLSGFVALLCGFLSYLLYSPKRPITELITYLEQIIIEKKYQLSYQTQPEALGRPLNPTLMISTLKQQFPIFERGSLSNDIPFFASSTWQEENGKSHQVLIFQYHYVNELSIRDQHNEKIQLKELHQDLWGVFIFDLDHDLPTFAASTEHQKLPAPYHLAWQSSDIQIRERLYIGGSNSLEMAKKLTPRFMLKLGDFFATRQGELYINHNQNMLCYIGRDNLMQIESRQQKNIQDISVLRGHLRTFKLPLLERLKKQLIQLLD